MDRKDFINSIGMSAAAFALINCVGLRKIILVHLTPQGQRGLILVLPADL